MIDKKLGVYEVNGGRHVFGEILITTEEYVVIKSRFHNCLGFVDKGYRFIHEMTDFKFETLSEEYCECGNCKGVRVKLTQETAISVSKEERKL